MRYATVSIRWDDTELMPINSAIAADSDVHLEATYYINSLRDGTYAELSRFNGDMTRAAELFEECQQVVQFNISSTSDGICYLQYEPAPLIDELMRLLSEYAVVILWPIKSTTDTLGVEITFIGPDPVLTKFFAKFPDAVNLQLKRTGDYFESYSDPLSLLTERQRDVFDCAIRHGYYEHPRDATHRDLAEELDVNPGTVTEHLQRIEATIMRSLSEPG